MKFLMFITTFSMLTMVGAFTIYFHNMDTSMTGTFNDAITQAQMDCVSPLCQRSLMEDMSTGECLIHCLSVYSNQLSSSIAVLPNGSSFVLLALVIFVFFSHPMSREPYTLFDRRKFSNVFNKLLFHRSLATVVIRD